MSTILKITNPLSLMKKFVDSLPFFPTPTEESTMVYDYNKLMNILQKKELIEIEANEALIDKAHELSTKFSNITKMVIQNNISDFDFKYNSLQEDIEKNLTGPMYLYAKQWGISVKALYYYKRELFDKAIDLSIECVILNDYLIKSGIYTLMFRAAEQNKNIIRVLFKKGDIENACKIARNLLKFLFIEPTSELHGLIFSDNFYRNKIPYVREGYAYEFFRSLVSLMIYLNKKHGIGENVFMAIFNEFEIKIETPDRKIISEWINLKSKFYEKKYIEFIEGLNLFFGNPICKIYDVVKISLLLDSIKILEQENQQPTTFYSKKIYDYIDNHLHGQFYLKTDLSSRNLVTLTN